MSYMMTGHSKNADNDLEAGPPPPYSTETESTLHADQYVGTSTSWYGTEAPVTVTGGYTQPYERPSDMRSPSAFVIDDTQVATTASRTRSPVSPAARGEVGSRHSGCCEGCTCDDCCNACFVCCKIVLPCAGIGASIWAIDDAVKRMHHHDTSQQDVSHLANNTSAYFSGPNMTYGYVADGNATLNNATYSNATLSNVTQVAELLPSNTSTAVEVTWSQATSRRDRKP